MSCGLCERRKPRRNCPAARQLICDACCGRYRELTLDCPADCPHLLAAYRYQWQRPLPADHPTPWPRVEITPRSLEENRELLMALGQELLAFRQGHAELADADVAEAIERRLRSLETEASGLIYDAAPLGSLPRDLYKRLQAVEQAPLRAAELVPAAPPGRERRVEAYVYLLRILRAHGSGRPRSRGFLAWLLQRLPPRAAPSPLLIAGA